jgi:acylphosphatase
MRCVRVRISGRVQGVFFRTSCRERASELGVSGWVRNRVGGDVEALFEGPDDDVERMIAWCREGPPFAHVDRVEVSEEAPSGAEGFRIR